MRYLNHFEKIEKSDFLTFKFESHDGDEFIFGDEVWSNGNHIEIATYCEDQQINYIFKRVINKQDFLIALRKAGFIFFEPCND